MDWTAIVAGTIWGVGTLMWAGWKLTEKEETPENPEGHTRPEADRRAWHTFPRIPPGLS